MKTPFYLLPFFFLFFFSCSDDDPVSPVEPGGEPSTGEYIKDLRDGITILSDDSLAFVLFAPGKQEAYLLGEFNNWNINEKYRMQKDGDRFTIRIGELEKDREYICQYVVDNTIYIADPYTNKISDPWNDQYISSSVYPDLISFPKGRLDYPAMVVSTSKNNYSWKANDFYIRDPDNMVIYEILIRDFTEDGTVKAVKEKIPYLKNLGVDVIELMPFNEFEGNDSWGYNPSFYFATDKAYGTTDDYKSFIDECHANGIGVVMDLVLNHSYGQSPFLRLYDDGNYNPTADNPWYLQTSNIANPDLQWGSAFDHESIYTHQLVDSICSYWMSEYKIDGFRFDFTKGFSNTQYPQDSWANEYDADRVRNLKRIYDSIKKRNPHAVMICEHLTDNDEEKELGEYGIYLWGKMTDNFNEATMGWGEETGGYGYKGNINWTSYQERGWNKASLVTFMESHDEERIMFKNLAYGREVAGYNVKDLETALQRTEAAAVAFFSIPGPKMIWQFGEMGYDYELNNDRTGHKPPRWDYLDKPARKQLYDIFETMIRLRKEYPAFSTTDFVVDGYDHFKRIYLNSSSGDICVIANMDVFSKTATVNFQSVGTWKDYFTGESLTVTEQNFEITLSPGEYRLYMK